MVVLQCLRMNQLTFAFKATNARANSLPTNSSSILQPPHATLYPSEYRLAVAIREAVDSLVAEPLQPFSVDNVGVPLHQLQKLAPVGIRARIVMVMFRDKNLEATAEDGPESQIGNAFQYVSRLFWAHFTASPQHI